MIGHDGITSVCWFIHYFECNLLQCIWIVVYFSFSSTDRNYICAGLRIFLVITGTGKANASNWCVAEIKWYANANQSNIVYERSIVVCRMINDMMNWTTLLTSVWQKICTSTDYDAWQSGRCFFETVRCSDNVPFVQNRSGTKVTARIS
jgi:hypothetical protein